MKTKMIIAGTILATILMLLTPCISAVNANSIEDKYEEKNAQSLLSLENIENLNIIRLAEVVIGLALMLGAGLIWAWGAFIWVPVFLIMAYRQSSEDPDLKFFEAFNNLANQLAIFLGNLMDKGFNLIIGN